MHFRIDKYQVSVFKRSKGRISTTFRIREIPGDKKRNFEKTYFYFGAIYNVNVENMQNFDKLIFLKAKKLVQKLFILQK